MEEKNIIVAEHVCRNFPVAGGSESERIVKGQFLALQDVSLEIPAHSLTILRGRSGSGKTTLLNILSALDKPTSGKVILGGQEISAMSEAKRDRLRRKKIGFIFQSVSLIPMMSAYENVEFVLRLAGVKKGRKERAEECLKMVGLGNRMHHMPQEMSGGEQQRVAIARAVAHRPDIIFADEPTGELDSATALSVVSLFKEMTKKEGVTIVMTTHDVSLMGAGDRVYEIGDGKLISTVDTAQEEIAAEAPEATAAQEATALEAAAQDATAQEATALAQEAKALEAKAQEALALEAREDLQAALQESQEILQEALKEAMPAQEAAAAAQEAAAEKEDSLESI